MLQFIAPLAHAHADQQNPGTGLHIPGLEAYSAADSLLVSATAVSDSESKNFIFCVNDGIKQSRSHAGTDHQDCFYLPQPAFAFRAVIPATDSACLPRLSQFISYFQPLPLSPRAPPVL